MKIVRFLDESYGIRRWSFGREYYNFRLHAFAWHAWRHVDDIRRSKETVEKRFEQLTDHGTPISK